MADLTNINTPTPISVLSCKLPLDMKGEFMQFAAVNKMTAAAQLAYLVQEFNRQGGKADFLNGEKAKKQQKETADLMAKVKKLEADNAALHKENKTLAANLKTAVSDATNAKSSGSAQLDKVKRLEQAVKDKSSEIMELQKLVNRLNKENSEKSKTSASDNAEISRLKKSLEDKQQELTDLKKLCKQVHDGMRAVHNKSLAGFSKSTWDILDSLPH